MGKKIPMWQCLIVILAMVGLLMWSILMDRGGSVASQVPKKAYLVEKGVDSARLGQIMKQAMEERRAGVQVLVSQMNKNKKFQKEQLGKEGYTEFVEFYREALK